MTVLHMLDTDTVSYIIKRRSPILLERLTRIPPASVCLSVITQAELSYGLRRLPESHRLHLVVREFLQIVRVLAWGPAAAERYADIRHHLVSAGRPIGEMDTMIAAHAVAENAVLVTNNTRHFRRIGVPLTLLNWATPTSAP